MEIRMIERILGVVLLGLTMVACSTGPLITHSHGGLGANINARDQSIAAGQYTGTVTIVPTNAEGEVLKSEWLERGADGSEVEIRDLPSTCAAHISNNEATFNLFNGGMSHVVATGNAAPETCLAIGGDIAR